MEELRGQNVRWLSANLVKLRQEADSVAERSIADVRFFIIPRQDFKIYPVALSGVYFCRLPQRKASCRYYLRGRRLAPRSDRT